MYRSKVEGGHCQHNNQYWVFLLGCLSVTLGINNQGIYETAFKSQWDSFSEDYKLKMIAGIVAFEVVVDDLQANFKLSQNRTETEKQSIINNLYKSKDTNERLIADYMNSKK